MRARDQSCGIFALGWRLPYRGFATYVRGKELHGHKVRDSRVTPAALRFQSTGWQATVNRQDPCARRPLCLKACGAASCLPCLLRTSL